MTRTNDSETSGLDVTRDGITDGVDAVIDLAITAARAGRTVDVEAIAAAHPEFAAELRAVLPAVLALELQPDTPEERQSADKERLPKVPPREILEGDRRLGDFRLIREIGRGGMGVVYEAEQLSLRRKVALKVLPMAGLLDERALQRFKNEATAAAGLEHPHVVPVYSVGCERAVHFLAMRLIDGPPLSEVIRQARIESGLEKAAVGDASNASDSFLFGSDPLGATLVPGDEKIALTKPATNALSAETRPMAALSTEKSHRDKSRYRAAAKLIQQAAEALEYAHSLGVVHRDIKPSNLLLDARGNIWVADFGLAHLEGNSSLTMTGDVMGTLRYMSPEQATGRRELVDHRSDVYSLGVTLYELLTLQPAFPESDKAVVLRRVIEDEPTAPRTLDPRMPRDLETVVLKAISKDPGARYKTSKEFAEDLRRFLDGEPVLARRPSFADRGTKWIGRHRGVALSATVILAIITLASTLSTTRIAAAYKRETQLREEAERDYELAMKAIERIVSHVTEGPLAEDFVFRESRQRILLEAETLYTTLAQTHPADAACYAGRAKVREMIYRAGYLALAIEDGRKAIELAPNEPDHHFWLGRLIIRSHREPAEALTLLEQAVALAPERPLNQAYLGYALWRADRKQEGWKRLLKAVELDPQSAELHGLLAEVHAMEGNLDKANAEILESLRLNPFDVWFRWVSASLQSEADEREAVSNVREASLNQSAMDGPYAYLAMVTRAEMLAAAGRDNEAILEYDRAIMLVPYLPHLRKQRAAVLFRLGKYDDSLAELRRAFNLHPTSSPLANWIDPKSLRNCPDADFRRGVEEIAEMADRVMHGRIGSSIVNAVFSRRAAYRYDHHGTPNDHALASLQAGDMAGYRKACEGMLRRFSASPSWESRRVIVWAAALGPRAVDDYEPLIAWARGVVETIPASLDAKRTLGAILYRSGDYAEAAEYLQFVSQPKFSRAKVHMAYSQLFLAMVEARFGNRGKARILLDNAAANIATDDIQMSPKRRNWTGYSSLELLRREAEELLAPVEAQKPPTGA